MWSLLPVLSPPEVVMDPTLEAQVAEITVLRKMMPCERMKLK
jgi:hypothetical protein